MEKIQGLRHILTAQDSPLHCAFFLDHQQNTQQDEIVVQQVVRWVAGKRLVAKGRWRGEDVFAKLFFAGRRSRLAWQHELRSLEFMAVHKIPAPEVLYSGTAEQGQVFVVLMKAIEPAVALGELWHTCLTSADKSGLLQKIMAVLAEHHRVGLAQRDLHWDNFLCKDERVYTLDAGDLSIADKGLNQSQREENLAQFFSLLLPVEDDLIADALTSYNSLSSVTLPVSLLQTQALTGKKRWRKHRKYTVKKIFRRCTEFFCQRTWRKVVLCNRKYFKDMAPFLSQPDLSLALPGTAMLKEGNACTVWSVQTASKRYVVKRYNLKGFWHGLGRLFRPTNAAQSWRAAHLLGCYGILTPKPVAFVEERFGPCRRRAYFITEYMEGVDFWDYFFDDSRSMTEKEERALQTRDLFALLLKIGIRHGDMKGQNLLVTEAGIGLIDLDDVRQFSLPFLVQYWHRRDLRRFMRNWHKHPELSRMFTRVLSQSA